MARSRSGRLLTRYLQEEITALEKWCNTWKIDLNAEKMQTIIFKRRLKLRIEGNVRLKDVDIEWRNEATYLGVKLDQKLTWGSHTEYARQKARATRAKLYPMTCRTSKLALRSKVTLIKTVLDGPTRPNRT